MQATQNACKRATRRHRAVRHLKFVELFHDRALRKPRRAPHSKQIPKAFGKGYGASYALLDVLAKIRWSGRPQLDAAVPLAAANVGPVRSRSNSAITEYIWIIVFVAVGMSAATKSTPGLEDPRDEVHIARESIQLSR